MGAGVGLRNRSAVCKQMGANYARTGHTQTETHTLGIQIRHTDTDTRFLRMRMRIRCTAVLRTWKLLQLMSGISNVVTQRNVMCSKLLRRDARESCVFTRWVRPLRATNTCRIIQSHVHVTNKTKVRQKNGSAAPLSTHTTLSRSQCVRVSAPLCWAVR